jgi:hypothetical protein
LLAEDAKSPCRVRSDAVLGAYVEKLTRVEVDTHKEALSVLKLGNRVREVAGTAMNARSLRSHAIFTVYLTQKMSMVVEFERSSKIILVDLAGSERLRAAVALGQRFKEAVSINKSLAVLGDVISSLSETSLKQGSPGSAQIFPYIPYHNSNLAFKG